MPNTLQEFLAVATPKAAADLVEAFNRIPADKREWQPEGKSRSALDQMVECTLLGGYTADLIRARRWPENAFDIYKGAHAEALADGWEKLEPQLHENAQKVVAAIRDTPDDALGMEIPMPWETATLAQVLAYPYWNMSYHLGQINYIASMLGTLD